jgi:general secretion pathway protein N
MRLWFKKCYKGRMSERVLVMSIGHATAPRKSPVQLLSIRGCGAAGALLGVIACGLASGTARSATSPDVGPAALNAVSDPITDQPSIATPDKRAVRVPAANPLWAIPLTALTATHERPLFSPSRRPPAPAVVAAPAAVTATPPKAAVPDRPLLTLVGTIVGRDSSLGVFFDQATNKTIRLWTAESHAGWTLREIRGREAILAKDAREVTLALPAPSDPAAPTAAAAPASAAGSGGTWVDGDGQRIAAPQTPWAGASAVPHTPAGSSWVDGDGQVITPPSGRN